MIRIASIGIRLILATLLAVSASVAYAVANMQRATAHPYKHSIGAI